MTAQPQPAAPIDYERLMQANLFRVFCERDAGRRIEAIRELYAEDAVLNEPHASAKGHAAISEAVTALLASLPDVAHFEGGLIHSLHVFLDPTGA